jgi:hypothetical protein
MNETISKQQQNNSKTTAKNKINNINITSTNNVCCFVFVLYYRCSTTEGFKGLGF